MLPQQTSKREWACQVQSMYYLATPRAALLTTGKALEGGRMVRSVFFHLGMSQGWARQAGGRKRLLTDTMVQSKETWLLFMKRHFKCYYIPRLSHRPFHTFLD